MMPHLVTATARVAEAHNGVAEVHFDTASACGTCGAQSVCGSGRARSMRISVAANVQSGDCISLQIPESELHLGAILAYLLPAVTTLLGGVMLASGGDTLAALGATLGLGFGLICLRLLARSRPGNGIQIRPSDLSQGETQ